MRYLILVRGLPGSGKSTLAAHLSDFAFAADDHFVGDDGVYRFDPRFITEAHLGCQRRTREAIEAGHPVVVVANTFTQLWEIAPYETIASETGATLVIIDLFDAGLTDEQLAERTVHEVPQEVIAGMRERYHR